MEYLSLADSIINGEIQNVIPWIEQGEDINDFDEYGVTPLIEAVMFQKPAIVKFLLEKGADPNFPSLTGHSALHWAADAGDINLCRLLLENGADPNAYSHNSQAPLVWPLLRKQQLIKTLFLDYKADLYFAKDFIQAKLLAQRYNLKGSVDIVNSEKHYIQLDMEGFFVEGTLCHMETSLRQFTLSFAARHLRTYFTYLDKVASAINIASEMVDYQNPTRKLKNLSGKIDQLLTEKLLLLPVNFKGRLLFIIKYADMLIKCICPEKAESYGSIIVYRMRKPACFNKTFINQLISPTQTEKNFLEDLPVYLELVPLTQLAIPIQITGNYSWANTEAAILGILYILQLAEYEKLHQDNIIYCKHNTLAIFRQWRIWDKSTVLSNFLQVLEDCSPERKAAKLMQLAALVFQRLRATHVADIQLAEHLLPLLLEKRYQYILASYKQKFYLEKCTPQGMNLMQLIEATGYSL